MRRSVPLVALALLALAYAVARPFLIPRVAPLELLEFPLALLVAAPLVWLAVAPPRPREPEPAWRRHEQVVRVLPDPESETLSRALDAWVETGARTPLSERALRALLDDVPDAPSRRKREALLKRAISSPSDPPE